MSHQRETATDQLSNVIQVIQLGRKSGILTVERGEGITFEEGMITFVEGQATKATVGKHAGIAAFNSLKTWHSCRFAFNSPATAAMTSPPHNDTAGHISDSTARIPALKPTIQNLSEASPHANEGERVRRQETLPLNRWSSDTIVPGRTRRVEEALHLIARMGLARAHRRLFLLIDGTRGTSELARLMNRERDEVQRLLNDLEHAGVIQQ